MEKIVNYTKADIINRITILEKHLKSINNQITYLKANYFRLIPSSDCPSYASLPGKWTDRVMEDWSRAYGEERRKTTAEISRLEQELNTL